MASEKRIGAWAKSGRIESVKSHYHLSAGRPASRRHTTIRLQYGSYVARVLRESEVPTMSPTPVSRRASPLRYLAMAVAAGAIAIAGYFAFNGQQQVPDATFTLLSGQKVSTADLKGKVYLINFWATNCDTCVQEMPQMVKTYNRFKGKGLEFVAVAMNYDAPMYVANYSETRRLPFKVAMDDGSAAKQFGNVQLTPTTFVVDKNGKILKRYVGEPQFAELDQLLEKALNAV